MASNRKRLECPGLVLSTDFSLADEDHMRNNANKMSNYLSPSFSKVNSFT